MPAPEFAWHRFWLAVAAYLVPTFPLGYVWHLVLFERQYMALELYRKEVLIPFGIASMLIQALLFAAIYPRLYSTRHDQWLRSAAGFLGVFGFLAWSFTTLPVAAKYHMSSVPSFLALETAFTIVQFLVVSPLIALVWRQPRASAP